MCDTNATTDRKLIIVLGDCNLSDFGEVPLGTNTTVLGITASEERPERWKRALPTSAVCSIRGRELVNHLRQILGSSEGNAKVRLHGEFELAGDIFVFDPSGSLRKWSTREPFTFNFLESDLRILVDLSQPELSRLSAGLEIALSNHKVRITLRDQGDTFSDRVVDDVRRLLPGSGRPTNVEVILDSINNVDRPETVASHYDKADLLARNRDPWFDKEGLIVFSDYFRGHYTDNRVGKFDACVCLAAKDIGADQITRLILIGLRKSIHPAPPATFGAQVKITLPRLFSIDFVPGLQRWIIEYADGEEYELDMYNSELIDLGSTSRYPLVDTILPAN